MIIKIPCILIAWDKKFFGQEIIFRLNSKTDTEYDDLTVIKKAFIVPLPDLSSKLILFRIPIDRKNTVFCRRNNFGLRSEKKRKKNWSESNNFVF